MLHDSLAVNSAVHAMLLHLDELSASLAPSPEECAASSPHDDSAGVLEGLDTRDCGRSHAAQDAGEAEPEEGACRDADCAAARDDELKTGAAGAEADDYHDFVNDMKEQIKGLASREEDGTSGSNARSRRCIAGEVTQLKVQAALAYPARMHPFLRSCASWRLGQCF